MKKTIFILLVCILSLSGIFLGYAQEVKAQSSSTDAGRGLSEEQKKQIEQYLNAEQKNTGTTQENFRVNPGNSGTSNNVNQTAEQIKAQREKELSESLTPDPVALSEKFKKAEEEAKKAVPQVKNNSCTFSEKNLFYCMLAPVRIFADNQGRVSIEAGGFNTFLNNLVRFALAIATGLATIMIVIGGVQYASTDAIGGKSEGAARIKQALTGLFLALVSYAILNTINPDVFSTDLKLKADPVTDEYLVLDDESVVDLVGGVAEGFAANGGYDQAATDGEVAGLPVQGVFNTTQQRTQKDNGIEPVNRIITDPQGKQFVGGLGSVFGGPKDHDNGKGDYQLPLVPGKTAKMLDVNTYYVAFRWDYTKKETYPSVLRRSCVEVYIPNAPGKKYFIAKPVDWGPNSSTGKSVDVSPGIQKDAKMTVTGATVGLRMVPCP